MAKEQKPDSHEQYGHQVLPSERVLRKRAVEQLRLSDERYKQLVEGSLQGLLVHQDDRIVFVNQSLVDMYGYSDSNEMIGMEIDAIIAPHEVKRLRKLRLARLSGENVLENYEYQGLKKNGELIWVHNLSKSIPWNGEKAIQSTRIDITKRKNTETALQTMSRRMRSIEESERRRIAGELHDDIGQNLTALKIHLHAMQLQPKIEDTADRLKSCLQIAEDLLQRVRNLALDLRPANLDDLGLSAALRWLIDQQAEVGGFTCQLSVDRVPNSLPKEVATACFRVVQEALTNVVRHAGAAHVRVEFQYFGDVIQFSVRDDGKGFDTSKATMRALAGESIGLLGMQERVELSGGQFEINSTIGKGTTIRATISLNSTKPV